MTFTFRLKVHIEKLIIISHAYLLQIHFVHYNTKYSEIGAALSQSDGLMVMGFFLEVTHF